MPKRQPESTTPADSAATPPVQEGTNVRNAGYFSGVVLKAAAKGDIKAVANHLAQNSRWLNQEGPHGRTLLWEAAYKGRTEMVAWLIKRGADVNPLGSYYTPMLVELSALAVARAAGRDELANLLIQHGAVDDLYAACHRGDLKAILGFLEDDPAAVNRPARDLPPRPRMGYHPIHYAVAGQQMEAAELLVVRGAAVAAHLPLLVDWAGGHTGIIRYLKKQVPDWKTRLKSPHDHIPAVDRPDFWGFPPLVEACRGNHNATDDPARVKRLLDRGARINIVDHKGKTALHRACQAGFVHITALLIEHGVDLEQPDPKNRTPIYDAARYGRPAAIRLMAQHGASLDHLDHRGETPLFEAARAGRFAAFTALLEAGSDIHHRNAHGKGIRDVVSKAASRQADRPKILALIDSQLA